MQTARLEQVRMQRAVAVISALVVVSAVLAVPFVSATPRSNASTRGEILFPEGSVIHLVNISPLATFIVPGSGGQFLGEAIVDHSVLLWVWTNSTPLPMCPAVLGYIGSPWTYSVDVALRPGYYQFGPVCGGLANMTVTQNIEVLYN